MGHLPDMDNGLVGKAGRSNSNYPRGYRPKKSSKVGSMTTAGINSTSTEVAAPAPTAQTTNNEISFVLKASPVAPEKQSDFRSFYSKPDRRKVPVCKDYPIQLFTGRLFLYGQLLYPPLPNTEDYGKRGANQ